jgi:HEAT repeat protein
MDAVDSADAAVKDAALATLGGVGDVSSIPRLVEAIQKGGESADIARRSLETVFADGVDQAVVDIMKHTDDQARRARFIEILDKRRAAVAVPALLEEVTSTDGNVRRKAISALGNVAGPDDVSGMVRGLLKIHDASERDEAGRAIAAVCTRIGDEAKQADPVLAAYRDAPASEQILLLPVLGRIGGPNALALIREAIAGSDNARRDSGYQALFNWPTVSAADDLAKLAETTRDQDLKSRAVRELARLAVLPGPISDNSRLAILTRGFKQADRNEEKRLILDRARAVHSFAAVEFAADHMSEPRLASQAIATVVDLLHRGEIRKPNQTQADKILDEVIKLSKDKSLIERAKSFKSAK